MTGTIQEEIVEAMEAMSKHITQHENDVTNLFHISCKLLKISIINAEFLNKTTHFASSEQYKMFEEELNLITHIMDKSVKGERYDATKERGTEGDDFGLGKKQ